MKIIYVSHWRFPAEKAHPPFAMKTCESLALKGAEVELWIPWRFNPNLKNIDPFLYHDTKKVFIIRRLPAIDLMPFLPHPLGFIIMVVSFNISVATNILLRSMRKGIVIYFHDVRNTFFTNLITKNIFSEIHVFYKSKKKFINKCSFSKIKGFIVTNKIMMNEIHNNFRIPKNRMMHGPSAISLDQFLNPVKKNKARQILGLPLNQRIIVYTGHLYKWKGVMNLFEAHSFLYNNEYIYFIGGTDKDISIFRNRVLEFRIKNIAVIGMRPQKEIPLWQWAADVIVIPNTAKDPASNLQTSPVKLFEYMASGTPIVASDIPTVRNILDDTMATFFEADNPESLAKKIHKVLQNQDTALKKAAVARAEVEQYTWERRAENTINFIKKLAPELD